MSQDQSSLEIPEQMTHVGGKGMTPIMREASLRRRAYQCFSVLGFATLTETTQSTLLQSAMSLFGSAEGYAGSTMQAAIVSSSGTFTSIWQAADGYGYGVSSFATNCDLDGFNVNSAQANWDSIENAFERLLSSPVLPSCEHDTLALCDLKYSNSLQSWPDPPPPTTAVVDAAIEMFALLLPLQDANTVHKTVQNLVDLVRAPKYDKNVGRKAAVLLNATLAILMALRSAMASNSRQPRDNLGNAQVVNAIAAFLKDVILDSDLILRSAGSEAVGRLASLAGTSFLASQVKTLVETVVNNRDPNARAGCAVTFGAIHSYVGGLAVGPLLKTTVNVLMSLSSDPHPVVHYWAIVSLSKVISAASLSYSPFISGTLGMLFSSYSQATHEESGGILSNANLRSNLPSHQGMCEVIDGVIAVMGPELQESKRTRELILQLVQEFGMERDDGICVEAIKCTQHFLLFASEHVDLRELVGQLRLHLASNCRPLKLVSINALYQLVQKDALEMSKIGGDQLVEDLFRMLDEDATVDGVRSIITSWLTQTSSLNPSAWIDLCQRIMSRSNATQDVVSATVKTTGLMDDEGESLGLDLAANGSTSGGPTSRWRTQLFALQCLHDICTIVARSGRKEHFDIGFARSQKIPTAHLLISRVTDLIKMAFTASAAYVTEIRLEGLVLLRDIIETFAFSPDPDYTDAPLLEQHQAPITAALTPAFSADSTPEILASAIQVCGVFVGSGIIKEVSRMGRILKLLTSALEQSKDQGMLIIGDAKQLSPNASVMLRIATATAWAELEIARYHRTYLDDVIGPHRKLLSSLWIASLRDYASIRGDSEMLQDSTSIAMDSSYLALGREVLLPYYDQAWLPILRAVGNAMAVQDPTILDALDGGDGGASTNAKVNLEQPRALFYVVFGLVYETLANSSADATSTASSRDMAIAALQSMKSLVQPMYCGRAILEPAIFDEFTSLCYRMAMAEPASVQVYLVDVVACLARSQGPKMKEMQNGSSTTKLSPDAPLTHCLRICAYVLRQNIPSSRSPLAQSEGNMLQDRIALLNAAFGGCATIGETLGPSSREEVRAVCVALFAEILKDESCDWDLAGPTLPCLKAMITLNAETAEPGGQLKYANLIHGLLSSCLSNIDDMRGREGLRPTMKIKNNLLASVLILTSVPATMILSRAAVEDCCSLISHKLADESEASLTAAHCCKTLILTSTSPACNPILKRCTQLLIPGMIHFVAIVAGDNATDEKRLERRRHSLSEVLSAFIAFFSTLAEEFRPRMLGILLPTLMLLLQSPDFKKAAVTNLLSLATNSSAAFREATGKLDTERRAVLEAAIRESMAGDTGNLPVPKSAKPTIALRSF